MSEVNSVNNSKNIIDSGTYNDDLASYILYDVNNKLPKYIDLINELKNYQIYKFSIDSLGNQWFLYKPRNSDNITTSYGQLWVRLKNFPYAYPVIANTKSNNANVWENYELFKEDTNNIINFDINNNIGIVQFNKRVICFSPTSYNNDIDVINLEGNALLNITIINKLIGIDINCVYDFSDYQKMLGYIFNNNKYTIFYSELGDNQIRYKQLSNEPIVQYNYELNSNDGVVKLPDAIKPYPNMDGVFNIFTDENNVNIIFETPSY